MSNKSIMNNLVEILEGMYPHFHFKMQYSPREMHYKLAVIRNNHTLKILLLLPDTPMDSTMDLIKEWMSNLIKGLK